MLCDFIRKPIVRKSRPISRGVGRRLSPGRDPFGFRVRQQMMRADARFIALSLPQIKIIKA